jgi:hypothetical protein
LTKKNIKQYLLILLSFTATPYEHYWRFYRCRYEILLHSTPKRAHPQTPQRQQLTSFGAELEETLPFRCARYFFHAPPENVVHGC